MGASWAWDQGLVHCDGLKTLVLLLGFRFLRCSLAYLPNDHTLRKKKKGVLFSLVFVCNRTLRARGTSCLETKRITLSHFQTFNAKTCAQTCRPCLKRLPIQCYPCGSSLCCRSQNSSHPI